MTSLASSVIRRFFPFQTTPLFLIPALEDASRFLDCMRRENLVSYLKFIRLI